MSKSIDIAVVGATGLIGGAVLERLAQTDLNIGHLYPLASEESDGSVVEFGKRHLTVHSLERFDFSKVQIAILCVPASVVEDILPRISKQDCWLIDHSTALRKRHDVPLVVATVNPGDITQARDNRFIACPDSGVSMLSPLVHMLNEYSQVQRVNVVMLRAVSDIGKIGIDELSKQSIALFNLKPMVREQFKQQIAFNVIAQHAKPTEQAYDLEQQIEMELRKISHCHELKVNAMLAHVPVFYGHSLSVQLELSEPVDLDRFCKMIKKSPDLRLVAEDEDEELPTPVTHGANQEGVFIGRLHKDNTSERGMCMWLVADNVHQTAAINSVQITEILVKDYL